ncbi:hypothetical protein K493DRAFT_407582 [Basidiobolus meristosporus CBS 931.73]|uniref:Uncharacterized protein n=1 Tax=Basidiobolus meristosporus CBS 931.73 TaxID=1314790 RepID=A0A1Y1YBV4_9FUNG|nr:hypothetical protein K493DRAFT_407582 [Basidiobolus meristosporus CBS 931.73]|eukprot:ORX95531.1 hypothetical protein K493DRAFT_407582 [Basidiobolus meristosporus CBS 931.73]
MLQIPASQLSLPDGTDPDALLVHYARAFYTSPIFKLERLILRLSPPAFLRSSVHRINHDTDQEILTKSFQIGDTVASNVFTVADRDSKQLELHFTLDDGKVLGASWLAAEGPKPVGGIDGNVQAHGEDEQKKYYTFWFGSTLAPAEDSSLRKTTGSRHKMYNGVIVPHKEPLVILDATVLQKFKSVV